MKNNKDEKMDVILILDFGGQYCHLIARRVREHGVYSEIVSCEITVEEIEKLKEKYDIKGIILSGGPASVYSDNTPTFDCKIFELNIPILGLCYGLQLLAHLLGGKVKKGIKREYGSTLATIIFPGKLLMNLDKKEKVWMSHYDTVIKLPEHFQVLASTDNCSIAAFRHKHKEIYGLQWHPEVVHTIKGSIIIKNFIFNICKCRTNWKPISVVDKSIEDIKKIVKEKKAIIGLSGGIDSSVATLITSEALGKNLLAVFVDHGFMREGEPEFVKDFFTNIGVNIIIVNAQERFIKRLYKIYEPEKKRMIIGEEFIKVFEEIAKKNGATYLIQGTIYPDRIESGIRKHSEKIKSHHNVAGIPDQISFEGIIEPLKDLYKDEVKSIAQSLNLDKKIIERQPFPGPGLAVRIIGEITKDKIKIIKKADTIVVEEIEKNRQLKEGLWQYFPILTNTKSTGIKGDTRAYGYVLALRAVKSQEAMTANFAKINYDILEKISTRITNEIQQISRVVYDITNKPPATIEWE